MHDTVVRSLTEGFARRDDNRARNDAANAAKRIQRLRVTLASIDRPLSEIDHAVRWIDEWLVDQGCTKRVATWIEKAIRAWMEHRSDMGGHARRQVTVGTVLICPPDTSGQSGTDADSRRTVRFDREIDREIDKTDGQRATHHGRCAVDKSDG